MSKQTSLEKVSTGIRELSAAAAEKKPDITSDVECLINYDLENIVSISKILASDFFSTIEEPNRIYCLNCLLNEKIEKFAAELQNLVEPASPEAAGATI